ncbi:MAG: hypothetical protein KGJ06_03695 [Pseudomonadota bacterium]|nr:hypothetical protein [Pseudomonadota bacterium]
MASNQGRGSQGSQQGTSRQSGQSSSYSGSGSRSGPKENLSEAAKEMRSGNPQERREGAHILGQAGGHQSHKNDPGRK